MEECTGNVFDIKEFAVFDGPGIRTTVFMKGCPLHCMWCHNPEGLSKETELMVSVAACQKCGACRAVCPLEEKKPLPDRAGNLPLFRPDCIRCGKCIPVCRPGLRKMIGLPMTVSELSERLLKDRDVYQLSGGGVTFSGGEPFLQWPFVSRVLRNLREGGVHRTIETSGFTGDENFREAMELLDLVMMDWKISDPKLFTRYTGVSQEPVRRHLEMLREGSTPFIIRMPVIPGVNDCREHFRQAAELLNGAEQLLRVEILPYQRAAGAKYGMVGREYRVDFDEEKKPVFFTEELEKRGIPYRVFR